MAYGTLFHGGMTGRDGREIHVYVDREGYSAATYDLRIASDRLIVGQNGGGLFDQTRRSRSATTFVGKGAPIQEAKKIPRQPYGSHRVRVKHDGTEVYRGFVDTDKTTTNISEQRGLFTVRAKVGLSGLSAGWRKADGSLYQGDFALSTILADIFDAIGLARPIDAALGWRPAGMADSSDPLSIQAQAAAWQRTNDNGQTTVSERRTVLSHVVGMWGASLFLEDGTWRLRQPTEYLSGSTVTVHTYDATGTHQGTTTESATTDIDGDPWERDSDEVSGVTQLQSAAITFEHGSPSVIDFNGSFEDGPSGGADGWTFPTSDFGIAPDSPNSDSDRSLEIIGDAKLANSATNEDMKEAIGEIATADLGGYAAGSEEVELQLFYKSKLNPSSGTRGTDVPADISLYYRVSHTSISGTTYWFVQGSGWVADANLSKPEDKFNRLITGPSGSTWLSVTVTLPSPPQVGSLELGLCEPISRQPSGGGTDYEFAGYWDECSLSRAVEGTSQTLFHASDPSVDGGETLGRTLRIGDGPYESSPGALKTPSGNFTGSWRIVGESGTYALHELLAKEVMAALRGGAQLIRSEFREPTRPKGRRAVKFDSLRSWPVQVDWDTADDLYTLALVQLRDEGHPPDFEVIAGGTASSVSGGTGGGVGGGTGGASSWGELNGKPTGLFARNGGTDGVAETIALAKSALTGLVENQAAATFPGAPPADQLLTQMPFHAGFDFTEIIIYAHTAPTNDYDITVDYNGSQATYTLPAGDHLLVQSISESISRQGVLRVIAPSTQDPTLEQLTVSFDLDAVAGTGVSPPPSTITRKYTLSPQPGTYTLT